MKKTIELCLVFGLVMNLCACGGKSIIWQEQYDLGIRYLSEGNYEEAIIAFTVAIEIDSKQAPAYVGRGDAYMLFGVTEENLAAAQADYEKAIDLDETNAKAYLGLAEVYTCLKDYDKAMEILRQGLDKSNGNQEIADKIAEIEKNAASLSSRMIQRETTYDSDGNVMFWHEFTYDEQGRMATVAAYDANGTQIDFLELVYDGEDNVIVDYSLERDTGKIDMLENEYNNKEKIAISRLHGPYGVFTYTMEYNDAGQVIRETESAAGQEDTYNSYEYDSAGNNIRRNLYSPDGKLIGYDILEYDGAGRLKQNSRYFGNFWNDSGFQSDWLESYEVYYYDELGNETSLEIYEGDGNLRQSVIYS